MSHLQGKSLSTEGFKFQHIPISPSDADPTATKMPVTVDWTQFVKDNKKIVITGAPAAFTPISSVHHISDYLAYGTEIVRSKKVDQIVVLALDSPFTLHAWANHLGVKDTSHIKFASDHLCRFVKALGLEWYVDDDIYWSGRWALIVEDGVVTYAGKETQPAKEVTVSSVEQVISHL